MTNRYAPLVLTLAICLAGAAHAAAPDCAQEPGRWAAGLSGEVQRGERFAAPVGIWLLQLDPMPQGWHASVIVPERPDDSIARFTPPLHGPNALLIEGWHFRNADNTGPNEGSVTVPQHLRSFIFSPEVGREIDPAVREITGDDISRIEAYGRGWLYIDAFTLTPPAQGERAAFETMSFTACLTWPQ